MSSTCAQLESEPLFLTVKNSSSGNPITSEAMQVRESTPTDLCSATSAMSTENLGTMAMGADGMIELCCTGSAFSFKIPYLEGSHFGGSYQLNSTAEGAQSVQCVTLYLPSGVMNTTYGSQFQDHC
jgi:hypothetical protein